MTTASLRTTLIGALFAFWGCGDAKFFGLTPTSESNLGSDSATDHSVIEVERSEEVLASAETPASVETPATVVAPGPCAPKNARPLAGLTVTLNETTGLLTVTGDDNGNVIVLSGTGAPGEVAIGDSLTERPVIFPCVDQLAVYAGGGNDNIVFNASPAMVNIRGVRVDGGN